MFNKTYKNQPATGKQHSGFPFQLYACLLLFLCHASQLQLSAQAIGNWTFNNTLSGTPGLYNTVSNADFSAAIPTRSFNSGVEYFGENGWPGGAVNNAMYLQFSLSPLSGYQLDISSLVLRMRRSNTGSPAGAGPTSWTLRSSLDGFTANIATGSITHSYADYTITPGAAFVNIYTTISFRLYGYNTTINSGGTSRLVMDNIRVNGIGYLLPVKLGAVSASLNGQNAHISFTVYQAAINSRYYVERSLDGVSFSTLYSMEETTVAAEKKYSYTDNISLLTEAENLFYRIRLSNIDGSSSYSTTVTVRKKIQQGSIRYFIKNGVLYINGVLPANGRYGACVYTTGGHVIAHIDFTGSAGYNAVSLPVNAQVPAACIVHISNEKGYSANAVTLTR